MTADSSDAGLSRFISDSRNWGRWGSDDELGAVNLVTPDKVRQAASLVRRGVPYSLGRPIATKPGNGNPRPAIHFLRANNEWLGHVGHGAAAEFVGVDYHGLKTTHLDALCHTWGPEGGWNGIDGPANVQWDGVRRGGVQAWCNGISTRGVLVDIPRLRGTSYVTPDRPVTGAEITAALAAQDTNLEPGDALVVHCGRERWEADHPSWNVGSLGTPEASKPGLSPSCLRPIRQHDVAALVWDMTDAWPHDPSVPWGVHSGIHAFGLALIDNALLTPLAEACATTDTWEFFFSVAPLHLVGGTGSPVNPIAIM